MHVFCTPVSMDSLDSEAVALAWGLLHAPTLGLNHGGPYMHWPMYFIFECGLVNLSSREGGVLSVYISFITPARCAVKQSGGHPTKSTVQ